MNVSLLDIAKDYGPAALAIVGTVLGFLLSGIAFFARLAWKHHTQRMNNLVKVTADLAKAMREHENATDKRFTEQEQIVQGLRAEMHLAQQKWDHIRVSLLGCEANMKSQQNTITEHIRELAKIDSKLEAVFRFVDRHVVDVPKRATDK